MTTARKAALCVPAAAEPAGNTPEQFAAHIKREIARWAPVIKASDAKPD